MNFPNLRYMIYGVLLTVALYAFPAQKHLDCFQHKDVVLTLMKHGFTYMAVAKVNSQDVIQIFLNLDTRDWIIIEIDTAPRTNTACVLETGTDWHFPGEVDI